MRTRCSTALLGLVLLTGCTSSPDKPAGPALPSEADFAQGGCADVAADVIAVGAALPRLGDGGMVDKPVRDSLRDSQDRLDSFAGGAAPEVKTALDDLVLRIGLVRIRADGNSYAAVLGDQLRTSYDAAVVACTAPAAPASPAPVIEVTLPPDLTSPTAAPAPTGTPPG